MRLKYTPLSGHTIGLAVFAVALFLTGCFGRTEENKLAYPDNVIISTFESSELGIGFEYPLTWGTEVTEDAVAEQAFIMFEPTCTENCAGLFIDITEYRDVEQYKTSLAEKYNSADSKPVSIEHNEFLATKIEKDLSYREDFLLAIHNKKDKLYEFRLHAPSPWSTEPDAAREEEWKEANANFNRIISTFREIPVVPEAVTLMPSDGPQHKFDSCGGLSLYASKDFYADFEQKLVEFDRFASPMDRARFGATKIQTGDITEACYSSAGEILIGMIKGGYCEFGAIIKYETNTGKITLSDNKPARLEANKCDASLQGFGKRRGHVIEVFAGFGDAGLTVEQTLNYDFTNGVVYLKKSCVKGEGVEGGGETEKCTEY